MDREAEKAKDGTLWRTVRLCGREFPIRFVYYEDEGSSYPDLPDFDRVPQYTEDGQPFTLTVTEVCPLVPPETDNCGCCAFLFRESHGDPIGVCRNPNRRRSVNCETEERR